MEAGHTEEARLDKLGKVQGESPLITLMTAKLQTRNMELHQLIQKSLLLLLLKEESGIA